MSSHPRPDPEAELRNLASLVAECRELAGKLDRLDTVSSRQAAPFLYRQLGQALQLLGQAVRSAGEHAEEGSGPATTSTQGAGLFGKLKRSFLGSSRKEEEEEKRDDGLQGNSWTVAIPELIGFLSNARKTGALWVHAPNETFLLQIRDGVLLHATSDSTPEGERLGELLVASGALTEEDLAAFLAQPSRSGMLGLSLHSEGFVTERQLLDVLAQQVQRLFHRMLSARNSVFRFQEGVELLIEHHVHLNCMQLLLETAKMFDERSAKKLEAAAVEAGAAVAAVAPEEAAEAALDAVFGGVLDEPDSLARPETEPTEEAEQAGADEEAESDEEESEKGSGEADDEEVEETLEKSGRD